MRPLMLLLLSLSSVLLPGTASWASPAAFEAFLEHRELVATIHFDRGSSRLDKHSARALESALPQIRGPGCEGRLIRVEGYAGREGSDEAAFRLSMNRAYSVAKFLEARGVPCLVGISGFGSLHAGQSAAASDLRVEIAAYPKMFLFDFENARYLDMEKSEVKSND